MASVLIKRADQRRHRVEATGWRPCEERQTPDGGRDQEPQEHLEPPGAGRVRKDPPLEPSVGVW